MNARHAYKSITSTSSIFITPQARWPTSWPVGAAHEKTVYQIILRWHMQEGLCPVPGSTNPDHILENINHMKEGGRHDFNAVYEFCYHALQFFFPANNSEPVTNYYTRQSRISDVINDPAFGDFGRLLFPVDDGYWSGTTLEDLRLTWYNGIASWRGMQSRLEQLSALGIPTEFHAYNGLPHGFGLGTGTVAEGWIDDAVRFWESQSEVSGIRQVQASGSSVL